MPNQKLSGSEVRRMFLDYFVSKGHKEVHSSSLVPANDPTLLFTNAGMNQFKDVFLGIEKRDYSRATTSQKCVRAGGKHNDLENVGFTNRHHTFFEMLGNFSFGDYFKKEAIAYAWELVTSPEWFGIPKDKLFATIFKGEEGVARDDEAYQHWLATGVAPERIYEFGMKDNFWMMGDTGPCGPCSEIHYDMGPAASDAGHTDCQFGCECGRYVEIWNLVFMQFDKQPDGKLTPLPKPSIDTGAGLERVTAVMQGVISNYDTDLFVPLIERAAELTGTSLETELKKEDEEERHHQAASLRVIADHVRASTFLISDGVVPANEGRGYVLRKIIRRGIRHGRLLGQDKPFLFEMVFAVRDLMKDAYPELIETANRVSETIKGEETRFAHTLNEGLKILEGDLKQTVLEELLTLPGFAANVSRDEGGDISMFRLARTGAGDVTFKNLAAGVNALAALGRVATYSGERAFRLYDTFGLPRDFIEDATRDAGISFGSAGFDNAMAEQRRRAQASWKGTSKQSASSFYINAQPTVFEGYRKLKSVNCKIMFVVQDGRSVQGMKAGEIADVILDRTPFYAESGGQVGDKGWLLGSDHQTVVAEVLGCYFPVQGVRAHRVLAKHVLVGGDFVDAVVDEEARAATMRNHTGTHLLHAALRNVLGTHVKQAGSLVDPAHLRFDFSHFASVGDEELQDIEDLANKEVLRNDRVEVIEDVPIDVAVNEYHATALFGEKYGDRVRVIRIGDFSTELCGGTHTAATGEIGLIKVLKEGSVSSGVRRLEAVTGEGSLRHFRKDHELENVVSTLATHSDAISPADALKLELDKKDSEIKRLQRELDQARMKSASSTVASVTDKVKDIHGVRVLAHRVDNLERAQMRTLVDQLRDKLGSGVVVLGSANNGNVSLIVGVTKDLTQKIQAGKVIGPVAQKVGGKGGGRPDLAEAGGKDPEALDAALGGAYDVVERLLVGQS